MQKRYVINPAINKYNRLDNIVFLISKPSSLTPKSVATTTAFKGLMISPAIEPMVWLEPMVTGGRFSPCATCVWKDPKKMFEADVLPVTAQPNIPTNGLKNE